jgi:hypothetical protein
MIKSKKPSNTTHLTQETQQRASTVARRRRAPRDKWNGQVDTKLLIIEQFKKKKGTV